MNVTELMIASHARAEYYVTTNPEILECRDALEHAYRIKIRTPEEMVKVMTERKNEEVSLDEM